MADLSEMTPEILDSVLSAMCTNNPADFDWSTVVPKLKVIVTKSQQTNLYLQNHLIWIVNQTTGLPQEFVDMLGERLLAMFAAGLIAGFNAGSSIEDNKSLDRMFAEE